MHRIDCASDKIVIITYKLTRFLLIITLPMTKPLQYWCLDICTAIECWTWWNYGGWCMFKPIQCGINSNVIISDTKYKMDQSYIILYDIHHINQIISQTEFNSSNGVAQSYQCEYVKYCCNGTIIDLKFDYLNFEYFTMSNYKTFGTLILSIVLIYSFLFIGNICDNYFAQTTGAMADLKDKSHNVAGVIFLALENSADDISAAYAELKTGGNQTLLILDDLLGCATFNPIVIYAYIAGRSNAPKMGKVAFVRDCTFICIVGCTLYWKYYII